MRWRARIALVRPSGAGTQEQAEAHYVYGERGSIEWAQEHPSQLRHAPLGQAPLVLSRGGPAAGIAAAQATRLAGRLHPEAISKPSRRSIAMPPR